MSELRKALDKKIQLEDELKKVEKLIENIEEDKKINRRYVLPINNHDDACIKYNIIRKETMGAIEMPMTKIRVSEVLVDNHEEFRYYPVNGYNQNVIEVMQNHFNLVSGIYKVYFHFEWENK